MVKSGKSTLPVKNIKHEDREIAAKTTFETTSVEVKTPQTMIILLESKEDMVVLKALSALDKYASKLKENAQTLYELGIVSKIIPLLTHEVLYVRRFATKILSELTFLPPVADILIKEEFVFSMMQMLHDSEDQVVKEFSSSVVAELSKYTAGNAQLLKSHLINTLLKNLLNPDPDIEKNCLQIIMNLIKDGFDHELLTAQPDFSIKVFIELLNSEYVAIQNLSLDILNVLTQQVRGNPVPKDFQDCGGITKLLSITKNFEWRDIHEKCLDILGNIYNDPNIAQHFLKDGVLQLFNYMKFINDPVLNQKALGVISKITQTSLGRRVLLESGHIPQITEMILELSPGITSAACVGIANLTQDIEALSQILEQSTVPDLLTVLAEEDRAWEDKVAAAGALYNILQRDIKSCQLLVHSEKNEVFENILHQFNETVPIQAPIHIANCVSAVAVVPELKPKIVTRNLISSLLHCFEDFKEDTTPLKIAACEALCSLLDEPRARGFLHALQGLPVVWASITKQPNHVPLLQAAATFVHLAVTNDKAFTGALVQLDVLNWLLSQRNLRHHCPAWETALETVLSKFLPLKFATTGRLDFSDVTESGFYVTKMSMSREQLNNNKFPILQDFIENNCCPMNTIYVASFENIELPVRGSSTSSKRRSSSSRSTHIVSSVNNSSVSTSSFCYESKFLLSDMCLQQYIEQLKLILKDNGLKTESLGDRVEEGETITNKALIVGKFVADQMMGKEQTESCTVHTLDLHINELKVELMNSILPVGLMRVGLHLERALLFKVLADRVGLPTCLVRGHSGRAWVEVALPVLSSTPRPAYPSHLLQPTHLVDLMSSPGTLHPLGSYQASLYCGYV